MALSPAEVFKDDRKSRVWRVVDAAGDSWVIKRWKHAALRQRLQWVTGFHPAQVEKRRHDELQGVDLPVQPIEAVDYDGGGVVVTRFRGVSLYNWLRTGGPRDPSARRAMYERLGRLLGRMFAARMIFRDCKASNLLVDPEDHSLWLIDVGSARVARLPVPEHHRKQMIEQVWANLVDASTYADDPKAVAPTDTDRATMDAAMRQHEPRA
jgi:hypothetical protein